MKRGLIITESILNLMKMCLISRAVPGLGRYNESGLPLRGNVWHANKKLRRVWPSKDTKLLSQMQKRSNQPDVTQGCILS